ncbi:MAG: hypothetical protein U0804_22210 [Gemmataceae bacterium]
MDEDQHGSVTDDGFTKEQQDVYFQEERCPFCRSEELLFASRESRECGRTEAREVFCDECEEEWVEVHYRDVGSNFLLKPGEAEAYFDDDDDPEADDPDEDDDADGGGADVSVTGASADT